MIFGTSKDLGTCKSIKKNGDKCTSIVNKNNCEFCLYHIKQEYQKCSLRSELQSNFVGKGLVALRNKVLGKNEVFYAGKSYMAIPARKNKKMEQKDNTRLQILSGNVNTNIKQPKNKTVSKKKQSAAKLDISQAQRRRDLELLKKLSGPKDMESKINFTGTRSSEPTLEESKSIALTVINKLKQNNDQQKVFSSQYDLKSDLLNVENKNNFNEKISQELNLDETKSKALDVIGRLKKKQNRVLEKIEDQNVESNEISSTDLSTMFEDFFEPELDYDDTDNRSKESSKNLENNRENINKHLNNEKNSRKEIGLSDSNLLKSKTLGNKTEKTKSKTDFYLSNPNCSLANDINGQNESSLKFASNLSNSAVPSLKSFGPSGFLDLSKPASYRKKDSAKLKALKFVQQNGPLKKVDPNNIKGSGKKRMIDELDKTNGGNVPKKTKLENSEFVSDRFKKLMAASSTHTDLLEARDDEEQDKYFQKQEMREKMEEKMASTFKVACKAVRCLKCKYTSFSASDFCKKEGHPLKVFDTMKRFFKCGNCGNRTVSLEIIPTVPCKNCGSGKWEKTGMMKEKIATAAHTLSIRGGEQKFVNSIITEANLNLMVPDN